MGAWTEILTTDGVVPEVWEASISEEYLRQSFWMKWAGAGDNAVIQLNEDLAKAAGDAINTSIRSQLQGGVITGNTKTTGNEGKLNFYNYRQVVDDDKVAGKVENTNMTQQRAAFNVLNTLKSGIIDKRRLRTDDRITSALSDVTTGRVRGRYLYGNGDANWNATHATALANVDAVDDKASLASIDIAKRKAQLFGGNAVAKVRPYRVQVSDLDVQEWFVYVMHTFAARDLTRDDPAWRNPMLLIPPMANGNIPIFTGSNFKGGMNGVLIYEWEGIQLLTSTIQVAHNLLLGAQAAVLAWAQHGVLTEEFTNYRKDYGLEHHEINSVGKVVYDRASVDGSTNEDNAVVHHFTAAVAD